jgi:hypothetical protein
LVNAFAIAFATVELILPILTLFPDLPESDRMTGFEFIRAPEESSRQIAVSAGEIFADKSFCFDSSTFQCSAVSGGNAL